MKQKIALWLVVLSLFLSSCGGMPANQSPSLKEEKMEEQMMEKPTATQAVMMEEKTPTAEMMMEMTTETPHMMDEEKTAEPEISGEMMGETPAWMKTDLVDVNSGKTFTIDSFKGKVILVEMFAIWCPTCLRQQKEVMALYDNLGMSEDLVLVGLDVDPNEDAAAVKEYTGKHGFSWYYAVAPVDVAREIGNLYGSQFLNPPSAPILLIDRDGKVVPLETGLKNVEKLKNSVEPLLKGGM